MAAIPTADGHMIWHGRISAASSQETVNKASLRTGRMVLDNLTNTLQVIFETTFDHEALEPFHINDVSDVQEHPDNKASCFFKESKTNTYIVFDFKDVRPTNEHPLSPEQRADSLIRFLREFPAYLANATANDDVQSEKKVPQEVDNQEVPVGVPPALPAGRKVATIGKKSSKKTKTVTSVVETTEPEAVETVEPPQAEVLLRDVDPVMPSQLRSRITSAIFSNMEGSIASRRGKRSTAGGTSFAVAKRVRGRGLPNSGNTCYINSVLQSLCSTVVFKTSVTDVRDFLQNHCNATEEYLARVMPLSTSLCELFRNFLFSTKEDLTQVLLNVKNSVAKFPSNRQEDAHEFLTFMLDRLKKEYEAAKEDVTDPQKLESFPPEPVDTCFGHTIQRQFTCQTCFNVRSKKDVETFFIVDIGDKHRNSVCLSDIIQGSLREEIVDRRCSTKNCNGEKANMMSYISQIPEVFIILIRRYSYSSGEQSKRKDKILMEEKMSVVCEPQGDEPTRYSIDCLDHDYLMHRNFRILLAMFHGEGLPRSNISYQRVADDVDLHDSYVSFLMALTNQKTSFVRFVEKHLCDHLSGNAEKYAPLMNQTEPEFRRGINKCKHGTSLPTTLDLLACASVFKTNFWAFNGKRYVKFPPLAGNVAEPGDIFISPEMVVDFKNIKNRKFIYMLNSIVCHTGEKSEKGHYESLIRSPLDDEWLECNDNVVKEPNNRNVFIKSAETAYIMLYTQSRE